MALQVVYAGQNGGCYGGENSEKLYDNIGNSDLLTVVILFAASAIIWKCAGDESMVSAIVHGKHT